MKNLFERESYNEIVERINSLHLQSVRQWGKMEVAQMVAHCNFALEVALDKKSVKRVFIGRLLSPFIKSFFTNEKPFSKNSPTGKEFIVSDKRDLDIEKKKLTDSVTLFFEGGANTCTTQPHAFFGKLSPEEWARGMYKHLDHHLSQFGA